MKAPLQLSAFAADKGTRLGQALLDQVHPLIGENSVVAVKILYLYEADGQMLGGSRDAGTAPEAIAFLERLAEARYSGTLNVAQRVESVLPPHKKS